MVVFGLLLGPGPLLFINLSQLFHDVSSKSGFTGINVADKDDVNVVFFELINFDILVLWPLSGHECLKADLWIAFPDDDFLFFYSRDWLFGLLGLFVFGFLCFFLFFIKFKIIAFLNLLNVLNLSIVEFLTKRIGKHTIRLHGCIEHIQVSDCPSPYIVGNVSTNINKVGLIGSNLFWFPFFIDSFIELVEKVYELFKEFTVVWYHGPLEVAIAIGILSP